MDTNNGIQANKVELSVAQDNGADVLKVQIQPGAAFPGFTILPPKGTWDLSAAKGVEAVLTNPGDKLISISLQVANEPATGQKNTFSVQHVDLGAGETRTLQTVFGQAFGNAGFALDPSKVSKITFYVSGDPSPETRTLYVRSVEPFLNVKIQPPADYGKPPGDGLVLWLDPSKAETITSDATGNVTKIEDRSGGHHDATASSTAVSPSVTPLDGKHRPMLRFSGTQVLNVPVIRSQAGGVTVFVVYQRHTGKQSAGPNPTLIASLSDSTKAPDAAPNFCIAGPGDKSPWKFTSPLAVENAAIGPLTIGQDCDIEIGDVLVYDHIFTSEGERRNVLEFLKAKWGAPFPEPGWLREGPLDPKPVRTHDDLPLSDQDNQGQWTIDPAFSDDFKEPALDPARWHFAHTDAKDWWGRRPALFVPGNVTTHEGQLHIKLDIAKPEEVAGHGGYSYTAGYISTIQRTGYGYYEIEARPGKSEFDNAFWLTDTGDPKNGLEIDIFEMGPHTKQYHNYVFETAHVWSENGDGRHWGSLVAYQAPWDTGDDFHVYGLEWTKDHINWYIDGSIVRKLPNTNWHLAQKLVFDAEPMVDWFGPIDDKDFPTDFQVKYLKVWRQPGYTPPAPVEELPPATTPPPATK